MNKLIAFGDSFTWGTDLSDEFILLNNTETDATLMKRYGKLPNKFSKLTWPSLIANDVGVDYMCHAIPGSSNQTIAREFLSNVSNISNDDMVVINWTWINRWDFYNSDNEWETIRPSGSKSKNSEIYFKYIQSELWDKWESLKTISTVLDVLKSNDINFLMTCIDPLILDNKWHAPSYIRAIQHNINKYILWFDEMGFYDWSKKNNFPLSTEGNHPLDKAHDEAFKYIKKHHEFTK